VVLLHGFPDSWQLWRHQIDALAAAGHRVVAPDLRGFGRSQQPSDVRCYDIDTLIDDVVAVFEDAGIDRAALVGHDWGAALAWQVAFRRPDLVERLAVLSVGHFGAIAGAGIQQRRLSWYMLWFQFPGVAEEVFPRDDWRFYRDWAWDGIARGENPECERQIAALSRPGALTAGLNWYRANIRPEAFVVTDPLDGPRVNCPTMGVWSSGDPFLCEAQMGASGVFVDGPWRYERIDCDHWIPTGAPDRLNELLVDFLGSG
jgi:pimeloyl-ACP methyl ester carboxylesterase